ncbi:MAG: hypothetical protein EZS28_016064, partial [Streblomastix strix]
SQVEEEIDLKQGEVDDLKRKNDELEDELQRLRGGEDKADGGEGSKKLIDKLKKNLEEKEDEMKINLAKHMEEINQKENDIEMLSQDVEEKDREIEDLKKKLARNQSFMTTGKLARGQDTSRSGAQLTEEEINALRKDLADLEKENQDLKDRIEEMLREKELAEENEWEYDQNGVRRKKQKGPSQEELQARARELEEKEEELNDKEEKQKDKDNDLKRRLAELERREHAVEKKEDDQKQKEDELRDWEDRLRDLQERLRAQEEKLNQAQMKERGASEQQDHQDDDKEKDDLILRLQKEIDELKDKLRKLQKELDKERSKNQEDRDKKSSDEWKREMKQKEDEWNRERKQREDEYRRELAKLREDGKSALDKEKDKNKKRDEELIKERERKNALSNEMKRKDKDIERERDENTRKEQKIEELAAEVRKLRQLLQFMREANIDGRMHWVTGRYVREKQFDVPVELLEQVPYYHILLAAARYCDPEHTLQKAALKLLLARVPHSPVSERLNIARFGVFEDLGGILGQRPEGYTSEVVCFITDNVLRDNKDAVEWALISKMIIALQRVLCADYEKIKRVHVCALARFTVHGSDQQREELYKMNVLPSFIYMLNHPDPVIVGDAVIAVNNIILGGARRTDSELRHPYFGVMSGLGDDEKYIGEIDKDKDKDADGKERRTSGASPAKGRGASPVRQPPPYLLSKRYEQVQLGAIDKLYEIFKGTQEPVTKQNAAICIGRLYRALPLPDRLLPIVPYMKKIANDNEDTIAWNVIGTLGYLAVNELNHHEIMREEFVKSVAKFLFRKPKGVMRFSLLLLHILHKKGSRATKEIVSSSVDYDRLEELKDHKDELVASHAKQLLAQLK